MKTKRSICKSMSRIHLGKLRSILFSWIMALTTFLIAVSCDSDEEMAFQMQGNILPELAGMKGISNEDFSRMFVGYGWHEDEVHLINEDGTIEEDDYWKEMDGGPGHYNFEFTDWNVIAYFFANHIPALVYKSKAYKYEGGKDGGNIIYIGDNQWMRIVSVNGNTAKVIKRHVANIYFYVTLRRLTDDELDDVRRKYNREYH